MMLMLPFAHEYSQPRDCELGLVAPGEPGPGITPRGGGGGGAARSAHVCAYGWAKVRRIPSDVLWRETYYAPFWQVWTDLCHSIPLAAVGVGLGTGWQWPALQWLCGSMILHSLLDLPVHNDDAHRHWLPLSRYRFVSPLSYWDPRHYGYQVAFVEMLAVAIATLYLYPHVDAWPVRLFSIGTVGLYGIAYIALTRRRRQLCAAAPSKVRSQETAVSSTQA